MLMLPMPLGDKFNAAAAAAAESGLSSVGKGQIGVRLRLHLASCWMATALSKDFAMHRSFFHLLFDVKTQHLKGQDTTYYELLCRRKEGS